MDVPQPRSPLQVSSQSSQSPEEIAKSFCDRLEQRLPGLKRTYSRAARIIKTKEAETNEAVTRALREGFNADENKTKSGRQRKMRPPKGSIENIHNLQSFISASIEKAKEMDLLEDYYDDFGNHELSGFSSVIFREVLVFRAQLSKISSPIATIRNNIETLERLARESMEGERSSSRLSESDIQATATTETTGSRKEEEFTVQQTGNKVVDEVSEGRIVEVGSSQDDGEEPRVVTEEA